MIGTCGTSARDRRMRQTSKPLIGRLFGHRRQRGISRGDDLRVGVAAPLERVLDESGDIVLVFDDEDLVSGHGLGREGTDRGYRERV